MRALFVSFQRSGHSARAVGVLVYLFALLAAQTMLGGLPSGQASVELFDSTVFVDSQSAWPARVRNGWVPVQTRVENRGDFTRSMEISFPAEFWFGPNVEVSRSVTVAAGEVLEFESLLPALDGQGLQFDLSVRIPGREYYSGGVLTLGPSSLDTRSVLIIRSSDVIGSVETEWEEALSSDVLKHRREDINRTSLAVATWSEVSRRSEAYTSLDLVLIDGDRGVPPRGVLTALRSWVLQGGELGLIGANPRARAEAAGLGPWLEDRFRTTGIGPLQSWSAGQGRVHFLEQPGNDLNTALTGAEFPGKFAWQGLLEWDVGRPWLALLREVGGNQVLRWPKIPGIDDLPYRGFLALLLLFALLIGPVNFLVVQRRWKRPPILLLTIPVISVLATIGILLFGIFSQGIHVREATISRTLLDQREHVAITLERRSYFVGLSAGPGLRPGANTSVFGITEPGVADGAQFDVEETNGQLLRGDYLPSRRIAHLASSTERTARARLLFEAQDQGFRVSNALGTELLELYLQDLDGNWYSLGEPLAPEGTALLTELDLSQCQARFGQQRPSRRLEPPKPQDSGKQHPRFLHVRESFQDLWPGSYVAVLSRNPMRDDCGLVATEEYGDHVLVGILPSTVEEWQ